MLPILILCLTACSNDEDISNKVQMAVTPAVPFAINQDVQIYLGTGDEGPLYETISGPWALLGFDFVNNHDEVITIIAATFEVTGPDGLVRTAGTYGAGVSSEELLLFSSIKPEGDIDCDGFDERVFDDEGNELLTKSKEGEEPETCPLDEKNMSYTGKRMYIRGLLSGVEKKKQAQYVGGTYTVNVKFEGWIGHFDSPKSNFVKKIAFTVTSN